MLALLASAGAPAAAQAAEVVCSGRDTCTYDRPGTYRYRVPAGVERLRVAVYGAEGGAAAAGGIPGGRGGRTDALVRVRPGQRLVVVVGGEGRPGSWSGGYAAQSGVGGRGGSNGGGEGGAGLTGFPGGAGGGGASDLRLAESADTRILVAGGGGGASTGPGGMGGGAVGLPGGGLAGTGGTAVLGGFSGPPVWANLGAPERPVDEPAPCAGIGFAHPYPHFAAAGRGDAGGGSGGGGGGGGWYGGGTGVSAHVDIDRCDRAYAFGVPGGPGGGGSGYADPAWCSDVHAAAGVRSGQGLVVITPA